MKITQATVDYVFMEPGGEHDVGTCLHIVNVLFLAFDVQISLSEAERFWQWRSAQYDASWLSSAGNEEIVEWFERFVREHTPEDDED